MSLHADGLVNTFGHVPAAGALIGAVMKETKGQADAAKVRELLLKHLGQG